jgi:hypothetical protein
VALSRTLEGNAFGKLIWKRPQREQLQLLHLIPYCIGISFGKELELAHHYARSRHPELQEWAQARLPAAPLRSVSGTGARTPAAPGSLKRPLRRLRTCRDSDLEDAIEPFLETEATGLCEALEGRAARPSEPVCAALLRCGDPLEDVAREFARWSSEEDPGFWRELDALLAQRWQRQALPYCGHAWLHLWEWHCFAFGTLVEESGQRFSVHLETANRLESHALGQQIWKAVARLFAIWRYRQPDRLEAAWDEDLLPVLLEATVRAHGEPAAQIFVTLFAFGRRPELLREARTALQERLADMQDEVRDRLDRILSSEGLPRTRAPKPPTEPGLTPPLYRRIRMIAGPVQKA